MRDLERELRDLKDVSEGDFGAENEFLPMKGQCFEFTNNEYVYKMCPFDKCSQVSSHFCIKKYLAERLWFFATNCADYCDKISCAQLFRVVATSICCDASRGWHLLLKRIVPLGNAIFAALCALHKKISFRGVDPRSPRPPCPYMLVPLFPLFGHPCTSSCILQEE